MTLTDLFHGKEITFNTQTPQLQCKFSTRSLMLDIPVERHFVLGFQKLKQTLS